MTNRDISAVVRELRQGEYLLNNEDAAGAVLIPDGRDARVSGELAVTGEPHTATHAATVICPASG